MALCPTYCPRQYDKANSNGEDVRRRTAGNEFLWLSEKLEVSKRWHYDMRSHFEETDEYA